MAKKQSYFPDPLAVKSEKDKEEFGQEVAKAVIESTSDYMKKRNERFHRYRLFAQGKQPVETYLNQLTSDGKTLFENLSYKPRAIARKFEEIVVEGYMNRKEYPKVTALSKHISDRKIRKKAEAEYRMEEQELIQTLTQELGFPVEDPTAFVPTSKEENDLYHQINDQEREELLMQQIITYTAEKTDMDQLKRRVLKEQFQVGLHGLYTYLDNNGHQKTDFIKGEDCIYSPSDRELISDDAYFAGRVIYMPISEVRARWSMDAEKEKHLFDIAKENSGKFSNANLTFQWDNRYKTADNRPYDSFIVPIIHIWWKCSHVPDSEEGAPKALHQTAYEGYFTKTDNPCVLEWGQSRNILMDDIKEGNIECPFIFYMAGNTGDMQVESPLGTIIDHIESADLAILKVKSVIAHAAPPAIAVDLSRLLDIDLGEGLGITDPVTLQDIYRHTGFIYYNSQKEDGNVDRGIPITPINNAISAQLESYLNLYNFEIASIRDILGINEFRDGSKTDSRIGYKFAMASMEASNMATSYIYRAWVKTATRAISLWGIRIWDALKLGKEGEGYKGILGKQNIEWIQTSNEITSARYIYKYEVGMDQYEYEKLQANITAGITAGTLEVPDIVAINDIPDYRLAQRYLSFLYNKRKEQRAKEAESLSQANAMASAEAQKIAEQAKQETFQVKIEGERIKEQQRKDSDITIEMTKAGFNLLLESIKTGMPLSPEAQMIVSSAMEVSGVKSAKEVDTTRRELERRQMEDEQLAMEQAMAQQNQNPNAQGMM